MSRKFKLVAGAVLVVSIWVPAFAQTVSFAQATRDYANGKYALALSEFETFKSAYPTNVQVHYYEALCYQALARLDKARAEYDYVAKNDNGRLKAMAQTALNQLGRVHGPSGGSSSGFASATPQLASAAVSSPGETKVRKVLEFYADW